MKNVISVFAGILALTIAGTFVAGCSTPARPSLFHDSSLQKSQPRKRPAPPPSVTPSAPRASWFSKILPAGETRPKSAPRPDPSKIATSIRPVLAVQNVADSKDQTKEGSPSPSPLDAARLRSGLVVNVTVLVAGKKEIEATGKRVTDNGTIAMPLLETVSVKDLTLEELGDRLTTSYREYFINPQVIVEFVRDDNKEGVSPWGSVTVLGRVKKPGKIGLPATRDLTLSAAIQQAGGFDTSAKETAIRITRRLPDGTMKTREVNLHSVGAKGLVEDDILLEPDDVVFIPELVF